MSRLQGFLMSCVCARICACVCVFLGSDETLSLTRCCSVKVKPYRMSGMMTRTERFHLIPPFPFFPSVPPIRLRPPPSTSVRAPLTHKTRQTYTGLHLESASRLFVGASASACMCARYARVCKQCQIVLSH